MPLGLSASLVEIVVFDKRWFLIAIGNIVVQIGYRLGMPDPHMLKLSAILKDTNLTRTAGAERVEEVGPHRNFVLTYSPDVILMMTGVASAIKPWKDWATRLPFLSDDLFAPSQFATRAVSVAKWSTATRVAS